MHVGTLDAADLSTASASAVLICAAPEVAFTAAHIFSLQRHIEAGGALLLMLQGQAHTLVGEPDWCRFGHSELQSQASLAHPVIATVVIIVCNPSISSADTASVSRCSSECFAGAPLHSDAAGLPPSAGLGASQGQPAPLPPSGQ